MHPRLVDSTWILISINTTNPQEEATLREFFPRATVIFFFRHAISRVLLTGNRPSIQPYYWSCFDKGSPALTKKLAQPIQWSPFLPFAAFAAQQNVFLITLIFA